MPKQTTLIPAVVYIRMSSSQQEASPEQQRAAYAELAKKHG
jgi:DNA invertase Pin-like site-specific DNA recombinase